LHQYDSANLKNFSLEEKIQEDKNMPKFHELLPRFGSSRTAPDDFGIHIHRSQTTDRSEEDEKFLPASELLTLCMMMRLMTINFMLQRIKQLLALLSCHDLCH
jgi:hypothetical protein